MGTAERRNEIIRLLCRRRYESIPNLAREFGVSARTVQRDIEILSLTFPIYTKAGRYDGGVYVLDGYFIDRMYMTEEELSVLKKLSAASQKADLLDPEEKKVLDTMISLYTKPILQKG